MKIHPAAKVYANSLFEVGLVKKNVERLGEELLSFMELCKENPDFQTFLTTPSIEYSQKMKVLEKIFKGKADPVFLNFLALIIKRGRFLLFPSMVKQFSVLLDKHLGKVRVLCKTAVELEEKTQQEIKKSLSKKMSKGEIILTTEVDPTLLGGILLEMDGRVIDASLKRKLKGFHQALMTQTNQVLNSVK